ncbi:unnamed protein product, partial [Brassica napus]
SSASVQLTDEKKSGNRKFEASPSKASLTVVLHSSHDLSLNASPFTCFHRIFDYKKVRSQRRYEEKIQEDKEE